MERVCCLVSSLCASGNGCASLDTRRRRRATHDTHASILDYMGRVDAGKRCAAGDGMSAAIPELCRRSGSWVLVDRNGKAVYELRDRANVEKALKSRPELTALTALDYLTGLNLSDRELAAIVGSA